MKSIAVPGWRALVGIAKVSEPTGMPSLQVSYL